MTKSVLPLSDQANALLAKARIEAIDTGCSLSGPAHIIMCVSKTPRTAATYILEHVNIDADVLSATIRRNVMSDNSFPSEDEWRVIQQAGLRATRRGCAYIDSDDLLLAALYLAGPVVQLSFQQLGISLHDIRSVADAHMEEMLRRGRECVTQLERAEKQRAR